MIFLSKTIPLSIKVIKLELNGKSLSKVLLTNRKYLFTSKIHSEIYSELKAK
jgi:hypothetical protein